MELKILSWNIKAFTSCVKYKGNGLLVVGETMRGFDLIVIYEISSGIEGSKALDDLTRKLTIQDPIRAYKSFFHASGGINKENDRVGVIYDSNIIDVTNTTSARRSHATTGGRRPIYMSVNPKGEDSPTWEFCAWHAPEPKGGASSIAQEWQYIGKTLNAAPDKRQTAVIMGDFNVNFHTQALTSRDTRDYNVQIEEGYTTLLPINQGKFDTPDDRYTANLYDNFFVYKAHTGTFKEVIPMLERIQEGYYPLAGGRGAYDTVRKISDFYVKTISDHVPVELTVELADKDNSDDDDSSDDE